MNVEVLTEEGRRSAFEAFYNSLLQTANDLPTKEAQIWLGVVEQSREAVLYMSLALMFCDLTDSIKPLRSVDDLMNGIVFSVFNKDGTQHLVDDKLNIRSSAAIIAFALLKTFLEIRKFDAADISLIHKNGFEIGSHFVSLKTQLKTLEILITQVGGHVKSARQVASVRSQGGKARADQLRNKAAAWKSQALETAKKLDAKHPDWTRGKLAAEIVQQHDWEEPGARQIEIWLKDEAEHPRGPITSRARSKAARTQVS